MRRKASLCGLSRFAFLVALAGAQASPAVGVEPVERYAKPKVWIYTDMSDPSLPGGNREGTINDPDDFSAMAGYLLMANEFETLGIVVASTHRSAHRATPDQGEWANDYFGAAYQTDVTNLNREIGGYPAAVRFSQSSIKQSGERYDPSRTYHSLEGYDSISQLFELAGVGTVADPINVLCWGSLTEPAILVHHCLATEQSNLLEGLRFIAHWTNSSLHQGSLEHPENVANCREDAAACAYLKEQAARGVIRYHECGAIGQAGIVSASPKGAAYFAPFKASRLGRAFAEGKYVHNSVDHSDSATYWVLLGGWGVGLDDLPSDGTNPPANERRNEERFRAASPRLHEELLRRSQAAAEGTPAR